MVKSPPYEKLQDPTILESDAFEMEGRSKFSHSIQWIYLTPILGAPITHALVSLSVGARGRFKTVVWVGIIGATAGAVINRLVLMSHSGITSIDRERKAVL